MRLAAIITAFEADFLARYRTRMLPSHRQALAAMKVCRSQLGPSMQATCEACHHHIWVPHSCGHRNCPHCQAHESQQWIARQLKNQVPADYFLLTFTLPAELRALAWHHQRAIYALMTRCSWETVSTFSHNDRQRHDRAAHPLPAPGLSPAYSYGGPGRRHPRRQKTLANQER